MAKANKARIDNDTLQRFGIEIPKTISEFHTLLTILRSFGFLGAYQHLDDSDIKPEACIKKASRSLDLMAFHGEKWLFEAWLEPELERLRLRQGKVRFLLSKDIEDRTLDRCKLLTKAYPSVFSARLFSESPIFRAVIIDDLYMLLGHYGYEVIEKDGRNAMGWKSPQLFIEDNRHWSLLIPFRELFRITWEQAKDVKAFKADTEDENNTIKREFHPIKK